MNLKEAVLIARLLAEPTYVSAFAGAFPSGGISWPNIELALATFERTILSQEAPFDRWARATSAQSTTAAKRGFDLFNTKGRCSSCHSGWTFSDGSFHDIGTAQGDEYRARAAVSDIRQAAICAQDADASRCRAARALYARRRDTDSQKR